MGSESESFVQSGTAVKEVDLCRASGVFPPPASSIELGGLYFSREDAMASVEPSEIILDEILYGKLCKDSSELSISEGANAYELHERKGKDVLLSSSHTEALLQQKAGKVSRKQHMVRLKDPMILARMDSVKDISDKLGSHPKVSIIAEKAQLVKQKNNVNSKRADRKILKVSAKSRRDSFSMKVSSGSFCSATSSASNFFGGYGLKSGVHDIAKLEEDLPLKDLLGGPCEFPILSKDMVKKEADANDSFLQSVRKACSIIQLPRLVQSLSIETDSVSTNNMSSSLLCSVAGGVNGDKGDDCITDLSSCNKDSYSKSDTPANPLNYLLYKPNDIYELLALPPPKDLDSLLQDATKPSLSLKNAPDIRSGKQLPRRASLQPFQWSHAFSGHCKPMSDSSKLSATKSSCPGRWSRIRNVAISHGKMNGSFINLESLTYDQSLVPLIKAPSSVDRSSIDVSGNNSQCSRKVLSSTTSLKASLFSIGGHCPMLEGAAQTLFDMATHSSRQNTEEVVRWPKKISQKAMKARKWKSNDKPEEILMTSNSGSGSDYPMRNTGSLFSSKKPRLYANETKKDLGHSNYRKGPLNWSNPRSSRSSPSKLSKDLMFETRYSTVGIIKQSCMMPPPDKTRESQPKVRKLMPMGWRRGKDRRE